MSAKNLLIVGAWAVGTVALLTAVAPLSLDAGNGSVPPAVAIQTPTLKVNGCELTLASDMPRTGLAAGDKLAVRLVMLNSIKDPVEFPWTVRLMVTPPNSEMSRVVPTPTEQWSKSDTCTLGPGERKVVALDVTKHLAAGQRGSFVIASGKQEVYAISVFVPRDLKAVASKEIRPGKRVASADGQAKAATP